MKKLLLASLLSAFAASANAGIFDGKTVEFQYLFPDQVTNYSGASNGNYTAGNTVPNLVDGIGTLDIQSNGFVANFNTNSSFTSSGFNGFRITDINGDIDAFTSFTLVSNTSLGGNPVLTFDANNLYVNWQGLGIQPGQVQFAVNAVPEPETYVMMMAGLGLVGTFTRRRKNAVVAA